MTVYWTWWSYCGNLFKSNLSTLKHFIYYMSETVRTLTITEAEETALVEIIRYFNDMGLPDNVDSTDYDTLTEKVCEPAFWEYN